MKKKLNKNALGYGLAIVSGICMILIWIAGVSGIYLGIVQTMQDWHILFSLSFGGLIGGIIEASILGYIFGWLIALFYNKYI